MRVLGLREVTLDDPEHGKLLLMFPIPRPDEPWGVLAPLRGTVWGASIRSVTGDGLSHAFHGWATPLMRELGPHPHAVARRFPEREGRCSQSKTCISATAECRPGKKLPDCYEPPLDSETALLAAAVALSWKEGRYVLVIEGGEFSL